MLYRKFHFVSSVRGEIGLLVVSAGFVVVVAIELLVVVSVAVIDWVNRSTLGRNS